MVALVSGVALIAVVVVDAQRALRVHRERELLAARDAAARAARALAAQWHDAGAWRTWPPAARFTTAGDRLAIPPELQWVEPSPRDDWRLRLDPVLAAKLSECERGRPGAIAALRKAAGELPPMLRLWLAWALHRGGDARGRDQLLAGDLSLPTAEGRASALLLRALAGSPRPAGRPLRTTLCLLPRWHALAILDRMLAARALTAGERSTLGAAVEHTATRRAQLAEVETALRAVAPLTAAITVRAVRGKLLWVDRERGRGALVDADTALALATEIARAESGPAVDVLAPQAAVDRSPEGTAVAVPGLLTMAPAATVATARFDGPVGWALLVVALACLCGSATLLAARAVRRETEASRLRAEFVTLVTHELKTPLAGIRLIAELLVEQRVGISERSVWLQRLRGEAGRLGLLIENVLDLGRGERGELACDVRRHDLVAVVRDAVELLESLAARDGLRLELTAPEEPMWSEVDRNAMLQVLLNLLDNALKYAADGGLVTLDLWPCRGRGHLIRIRDRGPGIAPGDRERVFERFVRGPGSASGTPPGVGLGLHLARAIAARHGGTLRLVDTFDGGPGACFELSVPAAPPAEAIA